MEKEYKKIRKYIFRYIIWLLLFWGIRKLLSFFQIEYRLWLYAIGCVISAVTPFILLGQCINIDNKRLKKQGSKPHYIFMTLYILISCAILFVAGIFSLFFIRQEHITEDGTLQVKYGYLLDSYYYPYERISFWGRKPAYGLLEKSMLEEKYGCQFTIDNSALNIGWIHYVPQTLPNKLVRAYVTDGILTDDLSESYIGTILYRVSAEYNIRNKMDFFSTGFVYNTCLVSDWSNPSELANDASILILKTLEEMDQDINAPCNSGVLYIRMIYQEQARYIPLPFGNSPILEEEGKARDYYTSEEHVYEELNHWMNKW